MFTVDKNVKSQTFSFCFYILLGGIVW